MKKLVTCAGIVCLILAVTILSAHSATSTATVYNYTSTALTVQGFPGGLINAGFGIGGHPTNPTITTLVLDDTATYNLGQYFQQTVGHRFGFSNGMVIATGLAAPFESEFFSIDGNNIYVKGIELRIHMVTNGPGKPTQELLCPNAGCNNGGSGFAFLGGADYVRYLPPADTNYNGVYPSIQFFSSGSSLGTLRLGTNNGIADWSGTGHSFVRTGPYSIRVTTDVGNVFDITAIPEPSIFSLFILPMVFAFFGRNVRGS